MRSLSLLPVRSLVPIVLALGALVACGDDPAPRDDAGSGGDTGIRVDGSPGDMGAPTDGGTGTDMGTTGDWAACTSPSECVLLPDTCCETCGLPTADDYDGVNMARTREHRAAVCPGDPPPCLPCVPAPHPYLQATCTAGTCEALDVRQHAVSECNADADCRVRVTQCCECGGDTSPQALIAVRASAGAYDALVCDPMAACPECEPVYPDNVRAVCGASGHCEIVIE